MVSVVQYTYCLSISDLAPVNPVTDPAKLRTGEKLNIWLEIRVNPSGLRYLRALGKLPIIVRWGRNGWLTDPEIDIGITPEAWMASEKGINWKAGQGSGSFVWRTHANKAAAVDGRYKVSVLDANKNVITTIDSPTTPFRPEISVTREQGGSQ